MNATPFLQFAGYVGVAVLAVLGNHFFGLPDTQTTVAVVFSALTALGVTRVAATTTAQSKQPTPPSTTTTRVGRQETP